MTFELPAEAKAQEVYLVGDFNNWDKSAHRMRRRRTGGAFYTTLELEASREYQFRYWVDGERWENEWAAGRYVPNPYGGENSVVVT